MARGHYTPLKLDTVIPTLPKTYKKKVTQEILDDINDLTLDPEYGEHLKETFIGYTNILEGKENFSVEQYVSAVKFFSLHAGGLSATKAYVKVFPERLQARLDRGETINDMGGEASRYNTSNLVNKIRARALIPLHLVNQDNVQKAINTLVGIMIGGRSEVARVSAATTLIKELRPPEAQQIELQVGASDAVLEAQAKQTEQLMSIAQNQRKLMEQGFSIEDIQSIQVKTIDVEVEEDE